MTQATTRMNLNHVMLRELSHAQKATENTIPFISMSRTGKPERPRGDSWLPGARVGPGSTKDLFRVMEMLCNTGFREWMPNSDFTKSHWTGHLKRSNCIVWK